MAAMIEANSLTKRFGATVAVSDVSLSVGKGEVLGFLGPNGAGKSTTMKMITGFLLPTAGTARIGGHDIVREASAAKRLVGYLPEGAPAYEDMTPRTFLGFVAQMRGLRGEDAQTGFDQAVQRAALAGVLDQPIETLSKGYRRRLGLAQALIHDPPVLILDEPTDGLDPNQKHEMRRLIRAMASEKAIIISTHILEEVEAVCSRAVVIAQGHIRADAAPAELAAQAPYHNAVRVVLAAEAGEAARQWLAALEGVRSAELLAQDGKRVTLRVYPADGRSIASTIAQSVREQGWAIDELVTEQGRLDDVFRQITGAAAA